MVVLLCVVRDKLVLRQYVRVCRTDWPSGGLLRAKQEILLLCGFREIKNRHLFSLAGLQFRLRLRLSDSGVA